MKAMSGFASSRSWFASSILLQIDWAFVSNSAGREGFCLAAILFVLGVFLLLFCGWVYLAFLFFIIFGYLLMPNRMSLFHSVDKGRGGLCGLYLRSFARFIEGFGYWDSVLLFIIWVFIGYGFEKTRNLS